MACADAGPALPQPPAIQERADLRPAGRALFVDTGQLRVYEGGRIREVPTPYPVREPFARLAPDGRVVALVGGAQPGDVNLWSEGRSGASGALARIPLPMTTNPFVHWSPGAQRVMYSAEFDATEIFVVGIGGDVQRASLGADLMHLGVWRSDDEVTLVTAKRQTNWPLADVTLWSWRPPSDPARIAGPITIATYPQWSPDGRTLATLEVRARGRAVHLRGSADRTLLTDSDLKTGPDNCARGEVVITGLQWSPDGRTLALLGRGIGYFAAFTDTSGRTPTVFAAPMNAGSCYIPGGLEWSSAQAVVPLFGPDCGLGGDGLANALALVDPATAKLSRYVAITRKGFLAASARWAAISASDGKATTFLSMDDPTIRVTVSFGRVIDYCCAD